MGIENIRGRTRFVTEVEDWMADQWSTEVFNFSAAPYGKEEMEITQILDRMLSDIVFGKRGTAELVRRAKAQRLIQGRVAVPGEQNLNTWTGNAFDSMFKDRFIRELESGRLQPYRGRLDFVPAGAAGPDVVLHGAPMIAWDVTTQAQIEAHVLRDSIGRLYDRYYLLIWDEPRTKPNSLLKALAYGSHG